MEKASVTEGTDSMVKVNRKYLSEFGLPVHERVEWGIDWQCRCNISGNIFVSIDDLYGENILLKHSLLFVLVYDLLRLPQSS